MKSPSFIPHFRLKLTCTLALLALMGVVISCDPEEVYEYSTSCVKYYHLINSSDLKIKYSSFGGSNVMQVYGKVYKTVSNQSEGEDKDLFDKLCADHGDVSFNRNFTLLSYPGFKCYYPDFLNISITSEQDYDEDHPAGSSLNDLFVIRCSSLYNWVQNSYDSESGYGPDQKDMSLSDITENDIRMLTFMGTQGLLFVLKPVKLPDDSTEKRFIINCQGNDGIMYYGTIDCILENSF